MHIYDVANNVSEWFFHSNFNHEWQHFLTILLGYKIYWTLSRRRLIAFSRNAALWGGHVTSYGIGLGLQRPPHPHRFLYSRFPVGDGEEGKSSSTSAYASSTWLLCPGCKGEWWCCMQRQGGGGSSKNHPMFDNRHRSVNKSFIDDNLVNLFIRNVVKKVTPMTLYTIWHQISYLV